MYTCRHVRDDAIRVDGKLSDAGWLQVPQLTDFVTAGAQPAAAQWRSAAQLCWSDTHLFVSFTCRIDAIRSVAGKRDSEVFQGECAEVFLCPEGAESPYYEIDFNPQNTIYDSRLYSYAYAEQVKHYQAWAAAYNADIRSATRVDGGCWSVEAAIPFADLGGTPHAGDSWLFNVFRIAQLDGELREYAMWMSTGADFHQPFRFPTLSFVKD